MKSHQNCYYRSGPGCGVGKTETLSWAHLASTPEKTRCHVNGWRTCFTLLLPHISTCQIISLRIAYTGSIYSWTSPGSMSDQPGKCLGAVTIFCHNVLTKWVFLLHLHSSAFLFIHQLCLAWIFAFWFCTMSSAKTSALSWQHWSISYQRSCPLFSVSAGFSRIIFSSW